MFDFGFAELVVVGVVGLIVLGPERLPKAMRTVGVFVRRARRSFDDLKAEVEREIAVDEMKKQLDAVPKPSDIVDAAVADLKAPVNAAADDLRDAINKLKS